MNLPAEAIIDRKKLKKNLNNWKIISVVLLVILLLALGFGGSNGNSSKQFNFFSSAIGGDYIARINIKEVIYENNHRDKVIQSLIDNNNVKAVIMNINSPGGTLVGSEKLYNVLDKLAQKKPLVTVMDSIATSGGYLVALPSNFIIAHPGTMTGSIGVIMQSQEITELAQKIGINFHNFKSSPLKASPNFTEKVTPEVEKVIMETINDAYDIFVGYVSQKRNLSKEEVLKVANGQIYTGRQAYKLKLVDAVGNQEDAIRWLEEEKGLKDLKTRKISIKKKPGLLNEMMNIARNIPKSLLRINNTQGLMAIKQ